VRASVAHDRILFEALARVGLPTALAPMRASETSFLHPVGATERTKRQSAICIGRDHVAITDARKASRSCDRFDCATVESVDARESNSRSSAAHAGRSSLSAQLPRQKGLECATEEPEAGRTPPQNVVFRRRSLKAERGQPAFPSRFPAAATEHRHIS